MGYDESALAKTLIKRDDHDHDHEDEHGHGVDDHGHDGHDDYDNPHLDPYNIQYSRHG